MRPSSSPSTALHPDRRAVGGVAMATVLLLMGAVFPEGLGAQTREAWNLESTTLPELVGRHLRVTGPGTSAAGTLQAVHPQSLLLSMETGNQTVLVRPSDTVWVLGNHKRSGAIAGALAGIALTAGFCIETFDECGLDVGLLVITPLFALAGAGFGSFRPMWEKVLP